MLTQQPGDHQPVAAVVALAAYNRDTLAGKWTESVPEKIRCSRSGALHQRQTRHRASVMVRRSRACICVAVTIFILRLARSLAAYEKVGSI